MQDKWETLSTVRYHYSFRLRTPLSYRERLSMIDQVWCPRFGGESDCFLMWFSLSLRRLGVLFGAFARYLPP